jgi:hypothetical protein
MEQAGNRAVTGTERPSGLLRGRDRMRELAAEAEAERKGEESVLIEEVVDAFGRAPTRAEAVLLENAAALVVLGRKLRRMGKLAESENTARLLARILRQLGVVDADPNRPKRRKPAPASEADVLASSPIMGRVRARREASAAESTKMLPFEKNDPPVPRGGGTGP